MDPVIISRLAQIRQEEILREAAGDRERIPLIEWSRLFNGLRRQWRQRSPRFVLRPSTAPASVTFEECTE